MKRKALLIGNTRGLSDTPIDLIHVTKFLMSYQGGSWEVGELICLLNKSAEDIMKVNESVRDEHNDYVIVYFTGHGGVQGDTIIEVNPANELLNEKSLFGLAKRQLNVLDCCRAIQTSPLPIYGSSRGMSATEKDLREKVREEYDDLVMGAAPQIVRMYSCSKDESSYGTGKNGSYYTNNLIECTTELLKSNDVVRVYQCHESVAMKTAADVLGEVKANQHPAIIPTKCLEQLELPIGFNPVILQP